LKQTILLSKENTGSYLERKVADERIDSRKMKKKRDRMAGNENHPVSRQTIFSCARAAASSFKDTHVT
jgi:hypothetical protein